MNSVLKVTVLAMLVLHVANCFVARTSFVQRQHIPHQCSFVSMKYSSKISAPTPDEAAEMGVRDWPQQLKTGKWSENVADGKSVVRYILDGNGSVVVSSQDGNKKISVGPGSLLEVTGDALLEWDVQTDSMIILTPAYEEGGLLAVVAALLVVFSGVLIANS